MRKQNESEELAQRFRKQFAGTKVKEGEEPGEATDRSSPISLNGPFQIRFERADIKEMEFALSTVYHRQIGYSEFKDPGIFGSLTAMEIFLWRGLREEDKKGELVHVFAANTEGFDETGSLLWSFMTSGGDAGLLNRQIADGFVATGLFRRVKKGGEQPAAEQKGAPKN